MKIVEGGATGPAGDAQATAERPTAEPVLVVGLGYVGLTLAAALAAAGTPVVGYDTNPRVREHVGRRASPFREAGVDAVLGELPADGLRVVDELPDELPASAIVSVGTPLRDGTVEPDLSALESAIAAVAERMTPDTLVVLRSTTPVGTCRELVHPILRRRVAEPLLAFCPERTIQGQALREVRELPQVVGAVDDRSFERAARLFAPLGCRIVRVSSLDCAEFVKLINNAHTDLIYGFGNEVARMAEALGVDALEAIRGANLDYPRPDLARPGFVAGSCLTKDPHILVHSSSRRGYVPGLVAAVRAQNEALAGEVAERVLRALDACRSAGADRRVLLCGVAYKGRPETDDVRGTPATAVAECLREHVSEVRGHDFVVEPATIERLGLRPVGIEDAFDGVDAAILLNDHPGYLDLELGGLVAGMRRPAVVFDVWGVAERSLSPPPQGIEYMRLGRG